MSQSCLKGKAEASVRAMGPSDGEKEHWEIGVAPGVRAAY